MDEENKTFREKVGDQVEGWRTKFEELEVQMALGKMDAKDKFEEQKSRFSKFIDQMQDEVKDQKDEKSVKLRQKLDELKVQVALGKMDAKDNFEQYKETLDQTIDSTLESAREAKDVSTTKFEKLAESFKTKTDLFKLHFSLGKMDAKDKYEEQKKEARQKLDQVKEKLDEIGDESEEKWDKAKDYVSENFSDLSKKVKGWFD